MFSLWTVSPDEGQGPEGHNVAMGGASCIHTRPPTCWPPCRRSRPPASGRPEGKGVLRQMVQHVLLALFLGAGAAGQRLFSLFSTLFIFIFGFFQAPYGTLTQTCCLVLSWSSTVRWCSATTRERLTWTSRHLQILEVRATTTRAQRGRTKTPSLSTWKRSFTVTESRWNGWWSTACSTTGKTHAQLN